MKNILLVFSLFMVMQLWAQDPFYIRYSTSEGLPSTNVYSVFNGQDGQIWFTTDAGIVKYNSHTFSIINTDNGLSDNEVFQMKEDYLGRIWMLTLSGKTSYLYKGKIYNQNNSKLVRELSGSSVMLDFYQTTDHTLYFQYRDREIAELKPNGKVSKLNKLKVIDPEMKKIRSEFFFLKTCGIIDQIHPLLAPRHPQSNSYRSYHYDQKDFFSMGNSLYQITAQKQIIKIAEIPDKTEIIQMYQESRNKLWVCSRNGLYLFENQIFIRKYFTDQSISYITQDFEGGYWISTLKNGVYYVPSFDIFIDQMGHAQPTKFSCLSVEKQKGVWLGGDNNQYYFKSISGEYKKFELQIKNSLPDQISRIRSQKGQTYIIGKKQIEKITAKGQIIPLGFGGNDYLTTDKEYFIGYNYTFKVSQKNQSEEKLSQVMYDSILVDKRTTVFEQDNEKNIWIGTNYGLYEYKSDRQVKNWIQINPELQVSILDLFYDAANDFLMIATSSKGLFIMQKNKIIYHITNRQGLNSVSCNTIKKLTDHYYMIGSNNGINGIVLGKNKFEVKNLNALLGLKNKKVNDIDCLNNTVYLATDEGLLYFDIQKIRRKKSHPICRIEFIKNQNQYWLPKSGKEFCFSYQNNDVSINYTGISYINQNNLRYYYRLGGQSDRWYESRESQINYKSLAPNHYTFSVYCVDGYGVKSKIQTIYFEIETPFWQETWFSLLCILLISLMVYSFVNYRLSQQQKTFESEKAAIQLERDKANLEKQMTELEQKALRLQMNPHFIFNALNTIKGYYSEGDVVNASTYISKFSRLLRMLLENTDPTLSLASEIEMLQLYLELTKIRYKNKFEYEIIVDPKLNRNDTAIPTLLLQPIVENAIIHGLAPKNDPGGMLSVRFELEKNMLKCSVQDNGIGRKASEKMQTHRDHESKALEITSERIKLFDQQNGQSGIEIIDLETHQKPSGTLVIVTIPIINIW
ncbi:MAG: histidine kinase [Flavobacteriaceae bacterium]